ncbi:hypothetical protein D3C81_956930 [compost metagenome]
MALGLARMVSAQAPAQLPLAMEALNALAVMTLNDSKPSRRMFSSSRCAESTTPKFSAWFFQPSSNAAFGSVELATSLRVTPTWPEMVSGLSRSSGLRVEIITLPPIEPSSRRASGDLNTSTLPTSCGASSE